MGRNRGKKKECNMLLNLASKEKGGEYGGGKNSLSSRLSIVGSENEKGRGYDYL